LWYDKGIGGCGGQGQDELQKHDCGVVANDLEQIVWKYD
jgi:hypothetical protein